ncbi:MAG: carboxylating nicotinate-nucleotide diphosphorylase [Cylindrospermopsis raciborskii]|uniref:carboxylating nicotinate-nucleotide diphosphorylase n=1 Tax=Cylindrospermopsis raciborskii TaxID=77022 RepID=UPI003D14728B
MKNLLGVLPPVLLLDPMLQVWLMEDIGRGDRTTQALLPQHHTIVQARWVAKARGIIAGLPIAARVFYLLNDQINFVPLKAEGDACKPGEVVAEITGAWDGLLMGERVALNLVMRLSGIASLTNLYVEKIADLPAKFVDTRKTTPGLRILEKYASAVGGAINHRMGLDDAVMIKDNHIVAASSVTKAIQQVRSQIPYPLTIEVETESIAQVEEALQCQADIIMLDNMSLDMMTQAVSLIRQQDKRVKIEASGNISLDTIRSVAQVGVDFISGSAPITQSRWLDLSMRLI